MGNPNERLGTWRACDELHAIENRVVAIRKKLSAARHQGSKGGEAMDDAMKLAQTIEQLALFGQNSTAAEALEITSRIEILISILEVEIDSFLAS